MNKFNPNLISQTDTKEFYFLRHGQTNDNVRGYRIGYSNLSLNKDGKEEAKKIIKLVTSLHFKTVCSSPLKRAIQTKNIVLNNISIQQIKIRNLTECSEETFQKMVVLKKETLNKAKGPVKRFINKVAKGLIEALSYSQPILIISHEGVFWAICSLLNIKGYWRIKNCGLVKIYINSNKWKIKRIN